MSTDKDGYVGHHRGCSWWLRRIFLVLLALAAAGNDLALWGGTP